MTPFSNILFTVNIFDNSKFEQTVKFAICRNIAKSVYDKYQDKTVGNVLQKYVFFSMNYPSMAPKDTIRKHKCSKIQDGRQNLISVMLCYIAYQCIHTHP